MTIDHYSTVENVFRQHIQVVEQISSELTQTIIDTSLVIAKIIDNGGTVFWCGNGGSAAESQHLAAELIGRFESNRRPLRSLALTTDSSVITCIANDYGYENVFARQVNALASSADVLIAISTSGNSENVVRALNSAREMGTTTVALLGKGGGAAGEMADHRILVDSDSTARIQEAHAVIGHILCELVEEELGLA